MALIYITGPTGSGKSTVGRRLKDAGYEVYDTDTNGIRHWINESGEPIKVFQKADKHSKQWLNDHTLGLPIGWLNDLKSKSHGKPIFVCGTSPIDHVSSGLWDKIVVLEISEQTLIDRVDRRTDNQYGKDPKQLEKAIKWRQATINRYKHAGAVPIDASLTLQEVILKILEMIT